MSWKPLTRLVLPWISHSEAEFDRLAGSEQVWSDGKVQVVFDRIRESRDEFHPTARTNTGLAGAHVGMHRTNVYHVSFAQAIAARTKSRMRTTALMGPSSHKLYGQAKLGEHGTSHTAPKLPAQWPRQIARRVPGQSSRGHRTHSGRPARGVARLASRLTPDRNSSSDEARARTRLVGKPSDRPG